MTPPDARQAARVWAQAIAGTSYVAISHHTLLARLTDQVSMLLGVLHAPDEDVSPAREAGAALVSLRFTDDTALSATLNVLDDQMSRYAPALGRDGRLRRMLSALAEGYTRALRELILTEQEQIHAAVIAARTEADRARWASEARFQAVFAEAAIGIGIGGLDGKILEVNQALCDMLGYSRAQLSTLTAADFHHPSDDPHVWNNLADLVAGKRNQFRTQKGYFRSDGTEIWTDLVVSLIRDHKGRPHFAVGMVEDITDRHRLQEQLRYQATHDPLTLLPNRTMFFDRLTTALTDPAPTARIGICYLDLDGFKAVNDTLGHHAGDQLLQTIAGRLTDRLAGPDRMVARMGGDEFVVLVDRPPNPHDVTDTAEAALDAVRIPIQIDRNLLTVTASIGVVERPAHGTTAAELMKAADTTLYWAKNDGRDRWALFDHQRHAHDINRYHLSAQLPHALEQEQFFLEYQPLVRLGDNTLAGVEALVRWRHPELGVLGPDTFITLAEQTGLIVRLGRWVLQQACRQAQTWHKTNPEWRPLISVNLSPRQVVEPPIVDEVMQTLTDTGMSPHSLQLELTESAVMGTETKDQPLLALHRLADLGVRIAIDDFGTGYSNLAYLSDLPVHALKLAGPFVTALGRPKDPNPVNTEIVATLIRLAHTLKLTVTAEAVETSEQAQLLTRLNCDLAQGWYYSQARPPETITDLLNTGLPPT